MTLEQELELSYYRQVADMDTGVFLVQDTRSKKFYVKKLLTVYNAEIYRHLWKHPVANTPRICLVAEADHVLTVIEEYISGDTLEEILTKKKMLPEAQVLDIATQLCAILADFHSCKPPIVNRDIKPANIKITTDGVVKLLDMNAAKWSKDSTKDTVLLGTHGYAAPEQYGFGASSVLTDIYAVGVLINEMLCGALPNQKLADGKLGAIAKKCMELTPADRYQSISALQAALADLSGKDGAGSGWRRFLPPGFRRKKPVRWIFSTLGYLLLFYISFSLEVQNAGPAELLLNRITFAVLCVCIVAFHGNYLNVQKSFILTRSEKRWVRWLGMALVDFALTAIWVVALQIVVSNFIR